MKRVSTPSIALPPATAMGAVGKAWDEMSESFDRFCLAAGVDALGAMMRRTPRRLVVLATSAARGGADTTGAEPKARLAFMPARYRLSGRACATLRARSWRCRSGNGRSRRTGSANGR